MKKILQGFSKTLLVLISLLFVFATSNAANNWYVSSTGSDVAPGDGSMAHPWLTLQHANDDKSVVDGDTIRVLPGIYAPQTVSVTKSLNFYGPYYNVSPVSALSIRTNEAVLTPTVSVAIPPALPHSIDDVVFRVFQSGKTVTIKGIKFMGGSPLTDGNTTRSSAGSNDITIVFEKNYVDGGYHIFAGTGTKWRTVTITDNYFHNMTYLNTTNDEGFNSSNAIQLNDASSTDPATIDATITNNKIDITNLNGISLNNILKAEVTGNSINAVPFSSINIAGAMGINSTLGNKAVNVKNNLVTNTATGFNVAAGTTLTQVSVNDNSFDLTNVLAINNSASGNLNATCNWLGTAICPTVGTRVLGPVTYIPFRLDGNEGANASTVGFQPTTANCGTITPINITAILTNASCGGNNGAIDITVSGGTAPYKFSWTKNNLPYSTSEDLSGLGSGTYIVTVTDAYCSTKTATYTITNAPDITYPTVICPASQTFCKSADNMYTIPPATASDNCGTPTVTYSITGATTRSGNGNNASGLFNQGVSTIKFIAIDGSGNQTSCNTTTVTVGSGAVTSVTISKTSDAFCYGITLTANVTPAGSYSYVWKLGSATVGTNQTLHLDNSSDDGYYTVTVTGSCGSKSSDPYHYQKQNVASNYTILGSYAVEFEQNNQVQKGSVGATNCWGWIDFDNHSSLNDPKGVCKSQLYFC